MFQLLSFAGMCIFIIELAWLTLAVVERGLPPLHRLLHPAPALRCPCSRVIWRHPNAHWNDHHGMRIPQGIEAREVWRRKESLTRMHRRSNLDKGKDKRQHIALLPSLNDASEVEGPIFHREVLAHRG